jgi:hypothetical protein
MLDTELTARDRGRGTHAATAPLPTHWSRKVSPAVPRIISSEFVVVCLFSLLGLTLTAATLSYFSEETIRMMFSPLG